MFSDASGKAYGAAIYAVLRCDDAKSFHLIASKTRVAPVKSLSLPRLELCAAVHCVNLLETVHRVSLVLFDARLSLNGWIQLLYYRCYQSQLARGKRSFATASPKFNLFYHSKNGIMLPVTKTQLIFALVESLQTKLQTTHCGGTNHLGYPKNLLGHIL